MRITTGTLAVLSMVLGLIAYKHYGNPNYGWGGVTLGLTLWSFSAYITELKYRSPQFVSETVHGSFDKMYVIDDYTIVPLGAVKAEGFYIEGGNGWGGEGFVVVPSDTIMWIGNNVLCLSDPMPADISELPPRVVDFLEKRFGVNEDTKVYYSEKIIPITAFLDVTLEVKVKAAQARLEEKLKYWHKVVDELKKLLNKRNDIVLEFVDILGYVDRKLRRTAQGKVLEDILKRPPAEEE